MVEGEPSDIVQRTDTAMYQAKRAGKNRVDVVRRASKSRLFQNGRPIPSPTQTGPITPVELAEDAPPVETRPHSALRRVR